MQRVAIPGRLDQEDRAMANYLLVFHGGSMPEGEAEGKAVMDAWTAWFASLGSALVDGGTPASQTRTIATDGSVSQDAAGPSGYSIIAADDIDHAVTLAKGCPVLAGGASLQVVETFNVM
jgi:hypothetical protein